jgi:hypothetical protein
MEAERRKRIRRSNPERFLVWRTPDCSQNHRRAGMRAISFPDAASEFEQRSRSR